MMVEPPQIRSKCRLCQKLQFLSYARDFVREIGSGSELESYAKTCGFCSIIYEGLAFFDHNIAQVPSWRLVKRGGKVDSLEVHYRHDWYRQSNDVANNHWRGYCFYVDSAKWPLSDLFGIREDIEVDTGSPKILTQLKSWVADCDANHSECRRASIGHLPTRVLDVQRADNIVFLQEPTKNEEAPYVALSHCWGDIMPIKTLQSNLNEFKKGIKLTSLPRTFRDAVSVTRKLGITYLWIDSLCIIQDSKEDWETEAARFGETYSGAYVTVSATSATDSNSGLFHKNDKSQALHVVRRSSSQGVQMEVRVRPVLGHAALAMHDASFPNYSTALPLLTRGWCFQEQLLSPRMLCFTNWEVFWDCRKSYACACSKSDDLTLAFSKVLKRKIQTELNGKDPRKILNLWNSLIETYSTKLLTYEEDKLPALSGLAQLFARADLGRYINGMWEYCLGEQLLWQGTRGRYGTRAAHRKRLNKFAAPSWAWISIDGPIQGSEQGGQTFQIVKICDSIDTASRFTSVSARTLVIRAALLDAVAWLSKPGSDKNARSYDFRVHASGQPERSWEPDVLSEVLNDLRSSMAVAVLPTKFRGLILRAVEGEEATYRRIGILGVGFMPQLDLPSDPVERNKEVEFKLI